MRRLESSVSCLQLAGCSQFACSCWSCILFPLRKQCCASSAEVEERVVLVVDVADFLFISAYSVVTVHNGCNLALPAELGRGV